MLKNLWAISVCALLGLSTSAVSQALPSPTINGGNPTGSNNLGGSTNASGVAQNAQLNDLGLNQGVTFDFNAVPTDGAGGNSPQWSSGLRFNNSTELQVQPRNTDLALGNSLSYAFDFDLAGTNIAAPVWGYTFAMNGFDNGDNTTIRAFRNGVQVPLNASYFTSNGSNVNVGDNGAGALTVAGPGNNNAQEFFSVALPIDVAIDRIVFAPTGKSSGSVLNGTVTLQFNGIGWARPDMSMTKSSSLNQGSDGITTAGDVITYTYIVSNDGRVPLENVTVVEETFTGNNGTPSPAFLRGTGGATPANLPVGETLTYTATYTINDDDIAQGSIDNRAQATSLPSGGTPGLDELVDLSDSANPGDGGADGSPDEDDPTTTVLPPVPAPPSLNPTPPTTGAQVCFEPLTPLPVSTSPINWAGISNAGGVFDRNTSNQDIVRAYVGSAVTIAPVTDDERTTAGNGGATFQYNNPNDTEVGSAIATAWEFDHQINLRLYGGPTFGGSITAMDINHDRLVITATDVTPGFTWVVDGFVTPGTGVELSNGGQTITITAPVNSNPRTFAEFDISTSGQLGGLTVQRDSLVATRNNNARFNIQAPLCLVPELDVAKSATVGTYQADGTFDVTYVVEVENTGDMPLDTLTLVDDLSAGGQLGTAFNGVVTSPVVSLTNASGNSTAPAANGAYSGTGGQTGLIQSSGLLAPGDSYSVTFTVNVNPFAGSAPATLQNTATAAGQTLVGDPVSDLSDTDTDPAGDPDTTTNVPGGPGDPTIVTPPAPNPSLEVVKTAAPAFSTPATVGDTITYTITVRNTGDTTLADVTPVDTLTDANGGPLALTQPVTLISESITTNGLLDVGETITYDATFDLTADAIAAGGVSNTAVSTGNPVTESGADLPGVPNVVDTSDDPTDATNTVPSGETGPGDPTVTPIDRFADLRLEKTATPALSTPPVAGDTIAYTITVVNTGNVALAGVTPVDTLTERDGDGAALTSPVTETNESVTDNDILDVGETITYAASVTLTQDMIDAGGLDNVAVSTGNPVDGAGNDIPGLADVTDTADDPTDATDADPNGDGNPGDPTSTDFARAPSLAVTKVDATAFSTPAQVGDLITYTIDVVNTGNISLGSLNLADTFADANGDPLALTSDPRETNESLNNNDILQVGETITYTATFALTQAVIDVGGVVNTVDVTGTPVDTGGTPIAGLTPVTDTSDDPDDTTNTVPGGQTTPGDPTATPITRVPDIEVLKTVDVTDLTDPLGDGQTVPYTITVRNTGNVALAGVTPVDVLTDRAVVPNTLALTTGPTEVNESVTDDDILQVGETITYEATYVLTQADIDNGGLVNTATSTGNPVDDSGVDIPGLADVSDVSDDPVAAVDNGDDDPTVIPQMRRPDLRLTKTADTSGVSMPAAVGDTITYTFSLVNTGNVAISNPTPVDTLTDAAGMALTLTTAITETNESLSDNDILQVGETITYTATFDLNQQAIDAGGVENTAVTTGTPSDGSGTPLGLPDVVDTSDDPADTTDTVPAGETSPGDPTVTTFDRVTGLRVEKTAVTAFSTPAAVGDTIDYTITVVNIGNVALAGVTPVDTLTDANGDPLMLTMPVAESNESITDDDILEVGETITYTAQYVLEQEAIDAGGVENTAVSTGNPVDESGNDIAGLPDVTDTSDDPADTEEADPNGDGNPGDPTTTPITQTPELRLEKTADISGVQSPAQIGDEIAYTITVVNTGNVALAAVTPADTLTALDGTPLALTMPVAESNESITDNDILEVGETITYTATYELTQDAISAGGVDNTAVSTGNPVDDAGNDIPGLADVSDTSDDPANTDDADPNGDGNPGDPTRTTLDRNPELRLEKTAVAAFSTPPAIGDTITYTITVVNTGNVPLASVTPVDTLTDLDGDALTLTSAVAETGESITDNDILEVGETITYTARFDLDQQAIDAGGVENTAVSTGNPVDDAGNDLPGLPDVTDTSDDPTDTAQDDPNGDGNPGDPTETPIAITPDLRLEKTATATLSTPPAVGDLISYEITVVNTGNVALASVTPVDTLTDINGDPLTLTDPVTEVSESDTDDDILQVGETITYSATFELTQPAIDAGGVQNTAVSTGNPVDSDGNDIPGQADVSDTSDDPTIPDNADPNGDGNPGDPTETLLTQTPDLRLLKTADTSAFGTPPTVGDIVTYTIDVINTGNVALADVTPVDTLTDASGAALTVTSGPTLTTESDTTDGILQVGETITYEVTFALDAQALDAGGLENTAVSTGNPVDDDGNDIPGLPNVTDTSDDPTDAADDDPNGDGNPGDPTETPLDQNPEIQLTKSVASIDDVNGNGFTDENDVINYTFRVENVGNVSLTGVTVADPLATVSGTAIDLDVGEFDATTFTASYTIRDVDVVAGGVENTATATGTPPTPVGGGTATPISDTSDTGAGSETTNDPDLGEVGDPNGTADDDGDPTNDPTVALFTPEPAISVIKSIGSVGDSNSNGLIDEGDLVLFEFTVTNTGNVALADVMIADPFLASVTGGPIDLDIGESNAADFRADYEITADDVAAGFVENTAEATGNAVDASGDPILEGGTPLTASDTSDAGTEPGLDDTGATVAVTDPEANETPDASGATDGVTDNDPTVLFIPNPALSLIKSVGTALDSNGDGQFGGEDDFITYIFTVRNVGNTDLTGVAITDPLFTVDGGPIDLAIGEGDSVTFTGQYQVTGDDIDRGYVENTAEAMGDAELNGAPVYGPGGVALTANDTSDTGTDPAISPVDDPEGTETPDGEGNTDGITDNDPTVVSVPANPVPSLSVVKSITDVADTNGSGVTDAGDTLTYSFVVTNTGNVALADVTITDPRVGPVVGSISLAIGESDSTTFSATAVITDAEVAQGYIENTATAEGGAVNGAGNPISDPTTGDQLTASAVSDAGSEPNAAPNSTPDPIADPAATESVDGEGQTNGTLTDDPTVLFLPDPSISLIKSVTAVLDTNGDGQFGGLNDEIIYSFVVTNTGNTPLTNVTIADPIATVSGGPIDLAVGGVDTASFTASKFVTVADLTLGYVENTALATGTALDPTGSPVLDTGGNPVVVEDVSDSGTDRATDPVFDPEDTETPDGANATDGDPTNDPTVVSVPADVEPEISLIKSVTDVVDTNGDQVRGNAGDEATYLFVVTNTGNTDLVDVVVTDPLLGGAVGTIASLPIGANSELTATYTLTDDDVTRTFVENSAIAEGDAVNAVGTPILDSVTGEPLTAQDVSDAGTDPETTTVPNPEGVETPDGADATDGDPTNDPTVLTVPLEPSDASVSGIVFVDVGDDGNFDEGIDRLLPDFIVELRDADGNVIATTTTNADGFYTLAGFPVSNDNTLSFIDPTTGEVVGTLGDLDFIDTPNLTNQDQAVLVQDPAELVLRKTSSVDDVIIGQAVPYEIVLTNTGTTAAANVTITDTLPQGMLFIAGSGAVDGTTVEPTVSGQTQSFAGINVPGGSSVTITLSARVLGSAPVGELVNAANALDGSTGERLTPTATASVRRRPEAVFDCTDIIGKVFNDRNMNGYQDGQQEVDRRLITDQNFFVNGKIEKAAPVISTEEPGIPGVRLVTPTGTIITTDEYGRYSVPCAELPSNIGSNFILKLDTRSLPTGFRVTTENPRSMRVTAGIMTEMNFGAAIGRVVDVDLTSAAFVPGQVQPVDRLEAGLRELLTQVANTPSVIRISYYVGGEGNDAANARLNAVEDMIQDQWRGIGNYRLIIEKTVKRLQ